MNEDIHFKFDNKFLEIKYLNFFGRYITSSNKRYVLGFQQGNSQNNFEDGKYALILENKVVCFSNIKRPLICAISNVGAFILTSNPDPNSSASILYIINNRNEALFKKRIKAGILSCGISDCSQYAAYLSNRIDNRGYNISLISIPNSKVLWTKRSKSGMADFFSFDIKRKLLFSNFTDKKYAYDFSGNFLDDEQLNKI